MRHHFFSVAACKMQSNSKSVLKYLTYYMLQVIGYSIVAFSTNKNGIKLKGRALSSMKSGIRSNPVRTNEWSNKLG